MELVSIVLLLAITPKLRREFRRPGFWVMLATALLCTLPPIVWNARHEWMTVSHLTARGGLHEGFTVLRRNWASFLGMHFGVYSPLIFAGMLIAAWGGGRRARHQWKPRFLLAFALPLFALYFWLSLKQAGEANWTAPGAISLAVLAVAFWHERAMTSRGARTFSVAALALGLVASELIINLDGARVLGIPVPYQRDPGARMRGWRTAAEKIEQVRADFEAQLGEKVFLIANKHEVGRVSPFT